MSKFDNPMFGNPNECPECGAAVEGVDRPYGGHFPGCAYFNATVALAEQRAHEQAWDDVPAVPLGGEPWDGYSDDGALPF